MIYYFSGLGNTAYVAKRIAEEIGEELRFIPDINPIEQSVKGESVAFFFPVYSWGIPTNIEEFINNLPESFFSEIASHNLPVWMVCTCGDETGNTPEMLNRILKNRGVELKGAWSVIMPNTYVLLPGFDIDSKEVEQRKLSESSDRIKNIVEKIKKNEWCWDLHKGSFPRLRTKLIYPLFKRWGVSPEKWHFTSACVRCGKCVKSCPVNNITMGDKGPEWGSNCLSCLACYHNCPYHAVEYGTITKNKGQYVCPL